MTITIGTDPEFLLVDKYGDIAHANNFTFFGSCDPMSEIGCDGAGTPVEIRPRPTNIDRIDELTDEITRLLRKVARYVYKKKLNLFGGANYKGHKPIGGHIHFGSNKLAHKQQHRAKLIKVLDCYFTPITNHFISDRDLAVRVNTGYGKLGAKETKRYGFEYRTPYSFLMSPFLTKAFFSLASLLAYHYKNLKVRTNLENKVHYYYNNIDNSSTKERKKKIYKMVKPMILKMMSWGSPNPQNNSDILSLFNLIERGRICKNKDVLRNYLLIPPSNIPFELIYSKDEYIRNIERDTRSLIKNKGFGELYLYGVGERHQTRERRNPRTGEIETVPRSGADKYTSTIEKTVYLSEKLPEIQLPSDVKFEYKSFGSGKKYENSVGLSYSLRKDMKSGKVTPNFLIDYLNALKLPKKDEKKYV